MKFNADTYMHKLASQNGSKNAMCAFHLLWLPQRALAGLLEPCAPLAVPAGSMGSTLLAAVTAPNCSGAQPWVAQICAKEQSQCCWGSLQKELALEVPLQYLHQSYGFVCCRSWLLWVEEFGSANSGSGNKSVGSVKEMSSSWIKMIIISSENKAQRGIFMWWGKVCVWFSRKEEQSQYLGRGEKSHAYRSWESWLLLQSP